MTWLEGRLDRLGDPQRQSEFIAAVRGNLLAPSDADPLVDLVCGDAVATDEDAAREITAAGAGFFLQAADAWQGSAGDFRAWTRAVAAVTGRRGSGMYMPLRAALTGRTHGPELAPLVALMGAGRVTARLNAAAAMTAAA
jgi:glutamyl-tRNA synthetase